MRLRDITPLSELSERPSYIYHGIIIFLFIYEFMAHKDYKNIYGSDHCLNVAEDSRGIPANSVVFIYVCHC